MHTDAKPKHDYVSRGKKRPGHRHYSGKGQRVLAALRLAGSILLCIVCFPLGLISLWTCKVGTGTKLLLTLITGLVFFALCAFALTVETPSPTYTRIQARCSQGLSALETKMLTANANLRAIAEQVPKLLRRFEQPALAQLQKIVDSVQAHREALRSGIRNLFEALASSAKSTLAQPSPSPKSSPLPSTVQTPVPTALPTPTASMPQ